MERRALGSTGLELPTLCFGTAPLGQEYGPIEVDDCVRAVRSALDAGLTMLDTSPYYGRGMAEVLLGIALRGVPRDDYVLCTKLGRYGVERFDFSAERVAESVDTSLHRLGTDHVDIMLCHDVEFGELAQIIDETLPALRAIQRAGKVRAVGISGYPLKVFREVLQRAELDVVLSYGHYTLQNRELTSLAPELTARGVGIVNAAPFDMRLLTDTGVPPWHPSPQGVRDACDAAAALCRERGSNIAKLALQFSVTAPDVAGTLVGSAIPAEVAQWLRWLDEPLDEALLRDVESILAPVRDVGRIVGRPENN